MSLNILPPKSAQHYIAQVIDVLPSLSADWQIARSLFGRFSSPSQVSSIDRQGGTLPAMTPPSVSKIVINPFLVAEELGFSSSQYNLILSELYSTYANQSVKLSYNY